MALDGAAHLVASRPHRHKEPRQPRARLELERRHLTLELRRVGVKGRRGGGGAACCLSTFVNEKKINLLLRVVLL